MASAHYLNVYVPAMESARFKLAGLTGREGMSQPFEFHLDLVSEFSGIPAERLIGQNMVTEIVMGDYKRFVNGFVSRFSQSDSTFRYTRYCATVVPWMHFLTKKSECRTFQDKKVFEIVDEVLKQQPGPPSQGSAYITVLNIQPEFEARSYCVQYRETDFNFISRLMEEEGIYYYFEHSLDQHKLVISNTKNGFPGCPGMSEIPFHPLHHEAVDSDVIKSFRFGREFHSGRYTLTAYDYQKPAKNFQVDAPTVLLEGNNAEFELYDHSADYSKGLVGQAPANDESDVSLVTEEGATMAGVRMQEEEMRHKTGAGSSTCAAITSGHKFTLADFPEHTFTTPAETFNREYLVTFVQHSAFDASLASGEESSITYTNHFQCIPASVQFRPPRITPRPLVHGMHSAVVTGPPGEEIYTDKYGRVKVQFYWDRDRKFNEKSSCWVRVSEPWAGKNWGGVFLPRIGHEVIVAFLEGDPDQPIIVSRVYNAENMHPYELPANQTQSGIKSRSSPGGGPSNFNELRFEDKKGNEQVYLHAERNLDSVIEANETRCVGNNRTTTIGHDDDLEVGNNATTLIKNDESVTVQANASKSVTQNQDLTVGQKLTVKTMNTEMLAADNTKLTSASIEINCASLKINAGSLEINSLAVKINSPFVDVAGVLSAATVNAKIGVVSPVYSPGVGNLI